MNDGRLGDGRLNDGRLNDGSLNDSSGGSRHFCKGPQPCGISAREANLICLSVFHVNFFVGRWELKPIAKTGWGP